MSKFELGLSYRFFVQTLCMNVNDGKDYRRYTYQVRKFNTTFSFFTFYKRARVPTAAPPSLVKKKEEQQTFPVDIEVK